MWSVWIRDFAIFYYCDFDNFLSFQHRKLCILLKNHAFNKKNFNKRNIKKIKSKREKNRVDDDTTYLISLTINPLPLPPTPDKERWLTRAISTSQTTVGPGPGLKRSHTIRVLVPEAVPTKYIITSCGNKIKVLKVHRNKLWEQNQSTESTSYHTKICGQLYQTFSGKENHVWRRLAIHCSLFHFALQ